MKYEKPEVEVVKFDDAGFMTTSANIDWSNPLSVLENSCGGYNGGGTNNFSCTDFGGYNAGNPPTQNIQVTIGGGQYTYVYDYKGKHWKLHTGNN